MQTAKTKGILLLLLLFTASLLLALGLALPRHTASAQSGVATVNGQTYDSFSAALAAAEEGDTVYVLKDRIDWMPSAQEIDANITIDLGSHASKAASGFSIYVKIAAGKTVTIQNGTFDGKGIKAIAGGEGAAVVIQNVKIDAKDVIAPALQIGSADSLPIEATVKDVEVSVHITATGPAYQNKTAVDVINADALLEGFTLNAGGENAEGKVVVNGMKATNSDMVVKNSTITSETGLGFGFFGGMTEEEAKTDTANYNTLTLENSSVSGYTFALAGNGTKHGTAVTIQNSTLTGKIGAGIYHPQVGTLTVGGADTKISGTSGIELRAGTLTVSGGEISATAAFETLPNEAGTDHADGSTIDGAAIAVSQHGYDPDIAVNITGGTLKGVKALYEEDLQNEDVSNISVTVSGGTFKGDVESENVTGFISGGTFSGEVNTDYVASGSVIYSEEGSNVICTEEAAITAGAVAKVGDTAYKTMQDAFTAAEEGDTVYVLKDRIDWMPSAQEIDANITIDLGDHASKAASGFSIYLKIAAGKTVTIQNGTFDGKGIKAIAGGEGAAVVIQNVKIDAKDVIAPALQIGSADSSPIEATVTDVEVSVHITATASGYHNKTAVEIVNADALLEEFTLNAGGENAEGKVVVNGMKATNSDMVVKNSTITSETGLGFGFFGGMTEEEAKTDTANYNTLTLENSSVSGYTFALAGNGTKHGTAVTIQNSTLTGTIGAGIYHPQVGTLTVGGADTKISGTSGIELRAGTLEVSGGEISATAKTFETLPNEAGSTIDGAAIAVSQHGYDPDIAVNITGGTLKGVKALYEEDLQNEDVSNISVTVSGGTFKGDVESENVTGFISGGTFSGEVNTDYVASGSVIYSEEGSNIVGSEEDAVAAGAVAVVDNTAYTTLEAAIESATEADTIQLLQDVTIGTIIAENSFTLDLNTYEISGGLLYISGSTAADTGIVVSISNGSINAADYGILINNNAELNLSDVVIDSALYGIFVPVEVNYVAAVQPAAVNIQGGSVNGDDSAMVICGVGDGVATPTKLIANGTKFTGGIYGISGNGSAHNTYIELNDCSVTAGSEEGGIGIYHPQKGEIVINGSEITGIDSGIEIRAGELNISGDTVITATATEFSARPNTNGTTMSGVAVAVSQHTTNLPIAVNITGGTLKGVKALYEEDLQDEESSNISVTVSGGTFEGDVGSENVTGFISGGSFQTLPNETLLGSGYAGVQYNGLYVVVKETTDVGALTVAKLAAQADIRSYSASLGFPWTDLSALSGNEKVDAILSAYNAVDAAESEGAVAVARLEALDAIDAYHTYLKDLKEAAIKDIGNYAKDGQDAEGQPVAAVAVPTYVISAINGAVSKAEIESYVTAAKAEIDEIRAQRTELAGNFAALNTKAETLAANLKAALDGLAATVGTNAKTLAELKEQLTTVETNIKTEIIADIEKLLGTAADEAGNQTLFGRLAALETALQTVQTNITETVTKAVEGVSGQVDSISKTLENVADSDDIAELTSSLAEIKGVVDGLEDSIGTLGEGETIVSILTALQKAQADLVSSVAEYHKAVKAALTGEGGIQAQLNELAAAVNALPDNTEAIAELNELVTAVQTDVAKALESLGALDTSVGGVETDLAALAEAVDKIAEVQNGMQTALTTLAQTVEDEFDALDKQATDLSAAVEKIADAVDALPTASVDLSGIEKLIGGLQADIGAANAALEGLDGKVSGLASLVGSLDGAQYSMNKALEAFEDAVTEQLTAIQTSLTALAADADDNGAAIAVLQQKADEIAADLQSGNADLTDVAENVVSLQSALEALSADVSEQSGMTGPIIGLYVIVSVLVVLMAAVLVILLKKKN